MPDETTRKCIAEAIALLTSRVQESWVNEANYHLTLGFLGNVSNQVEMDLILQLQENRFQSFSVEFGNVSFWRHPGILCLTPLHPDVHLLILSDGLKSLANACGIASDKRLYDPHITLARNVTEDIEVPQIKPFNWHAESFSLLDSKQGNYSVVEKWQLS